MRTKPALVVLMISTVFGYSVYGQNTYYWSGKKKIHLVADSSRIVVHTNQFAAMRNIKANLSGMTEVADSKEMSIGSSFSLDITLDKKTNLRTLYTRIAQLSRAEFVLPLYRQESSPYYFTNEIILQPKKGVSINEIISLVDEGASVKEKTRYNTFLLKVTKIENLFEFANRIYESGLVEWCHPNFTAKIVETVIPGDPLFPEQYYLDNTQQFGGTAGIDINAPEAWDITLGCDNIRVAVVDDGVEPHEDLEGRVLPGFTPHNNGDGQPTMANLTHGQACAGIIAASHDTLGISGIAPRSQIIPVNIFRGVDATNAEIAAGLNWAWDPNGGNADIISNSWAFDDNGIVVDAIVQAITNARTLGRVRGGIALGSIVVFASGNSHDTFSGVTFPANVEGVITVGAIANNGNLWSFSSRGAEMDLVAPTGNGNQNGNVRTLDRMGGNGIETGNYTERFGATSAACPQVSGVAALMLSANPNLTEVQVRNILQQSATDMGGVGFDNNFGFGRLNAFQALLASAGFINGSALVCTANQYTYQNLPAGTTLSWASSNPDGLAVNPASGIATRVGNFIGAVNVLAVLTRPGGCQTTISRSVWVGVPDQPGPMTGPTSPNIGNTARYLVYNGAPGASSHQWILPYNYRPRFCYPYCWRVDRLNTPTDIFVIVGTDPGYMQIRGVNACGNGGVSIMYVTPSGTPGCNPCQREMADGPVKNELITRAKPYPNPASKELMIKYELAGPELSADEQPTDSFESEIEYTINNSMGELVYVSASNKTQPVLDIGLLNDGIYILTIRYAGKEKKERIMIGGDRR